MQNMSIIAIFEGKMYTQGSNREGALPPPPKKMEGGGPYAPPAPRKLRLWVEGSKISFDAFVNIFNIKQ